MNVILRRAFVTGGLPGIRTLARNVATHLIRHTERLWDLNKSIWVKNRSFAGEGSLPSRWHRIILYSGQNRRIRTFASGFRRPDATIEQHILMSYRNQFIPKLWPITITFTKGSITFALWMPLYIGFDTPSPNASTKRHQGYTRIGQRTRIRTGTTCFQGTDANH